MTGKVCPKCLPLLEGICAVTTYELLPTDGRDTEDPVMFAKKIGARYPLAVATEDLKQRFGGIEGLPTTLLYDRQGILRQKVIGFEYTDAFEKELKPLL